MNNSRAELRVVASQKLQAAAMKSDASIALKEVAAGLANGTVGLREETLFVSGEIKGNTEEIFKQLSEQINREGLTNFNGAKLTRGRNAIITHAAISYASTAVATPLDVRNISFGKSTIDTQIENGNLVFKAGKDVIIEQPVVLLHNPNTPRTNDELFTSLGDLPIVEAEKDLTLDFNLPSVGAIVSAGDARHWVKVFFRAFVTYSK